MCAWLTWGGGEDGPGAALDTKTRLTNVQPVELRGWGHLVATQHPHKLSKAKSSSCATPRRNLQQPMAHTGAIPPALGAVWG